jgi:hypothetical protein
MVNRTIKEIGFKLKQAGRLETTPLCVYGSEIIPKNGIPVTQINRCIANAIYNLSIHETINSIYIGNNALEGCCPGGQAWLGYNSFHPQLKYFISIGSQDFRGGAAEFLLANPDLAEQQLKSVGKISPIGKYTVIQKCDYVEEKVINVISFLCFGDSEQIRNLCSLAYFQPDNGFIVKMPWGPSCASFISYPAGLINENKNSVILGPTDPTGNYWFPQNYLSIGIPFNIAERMANDVDNSFIAKRPEVAYPKNRK